MAAGVTDYLSSVSDLVDLWEVEEVKRATWEGTIQMEVSFDV